MLLGQLMILLLVGFAVLSSAYSAKILGVFSAPGRSHLIVHTSYMEALAQKGHDVTVVSSYQILKSPPPNYRDIILPPNNEPEMEKLLLDLISNAETKTSMFKTFPVFFKAMTKRAAEIINDPEFLKLKDEKFDLVIIGWFLNDFLLGVAGHFQCPSIMVVPNKGIKIMRDYVGSPYIISATPSPWLQVTEQMTFFQRLANFGIGFFEYVIVTLYQHYATEVYYKENFPPEKYPTFDEIKKNISLVLVNSHFSEGIVEPVVPAMVEVGGLHIKSEVAPLPKDIQDWLDSAEDGVIYFSLGSNVKSKFLNAEKVAAMLRVFSKIKQKVLWKWEDDQLPGKPDNVMIGKWLPQRDILAHPNIKVFISHCGLGGVNEAKFRGVPILGIPIYGDQQLLLKTITKEGWALPVEYSDFTEKLFSDSLNEILTNSSYSDTIKKISNVYRDRPQSPLDTAVFWIEYVIRHNGAKHMQSQAVHLNFFQYHSLDVIGFIFVVLYIFIKIVKCMFRLIINKCKNKLKSKKE